MCTKLIHQVFPLKHHLFRYPCPRYLSNVPKQDVGTVAKTLKICGQEYATDSWTNITPKILSFVEKKIFKRPSNPLGLIASGIKDHFEDFHHFDYPCPVVTLYDNFDSLLIPKDHVSRQKSDTYYVNQNLVFRCHTSAHQVHCLKKGSKSFVCVADVFRRDAIDSTHFPVFHQSEVFKLYSPQELNQKKLVLDEPLERTPLNQEYHSVEVSNEMVGKLKGTIEGYIRRLLGNGINMRWVDAYFPFTHPSFELEILVKDKWLEILGAGVIEQKIMMEHAVFQDCVGWAFGFGLERLAMLKYSIPDIRLFWSTDSGFLHQFSGAKPWDPVTYKPISLYPQLYNDVSFWLPPEGYNSNDLYDLIRDIGGDLVEQVSLVDEFTKKGRTSHCYRIVYRSHDRTLTQEEVTAVHSKITKSAENILNVEIR